MLPSTTRRAPLALPNGRQFSSASQMGARFDSLLLKIEHVLSSARWAAKCARGGGGEVRGGGGLVKILKSLLGRNFVRSTYSRDLTIVDFHADAAVFVVCSI